MLDSFITRAISGIRASAWPRFIGCNSCAIILVAGGIEHGGGAGVEGGIDGEDQHGRHYYRVMAGLVPAIHVSLAVPKNVDGRVRVPDAVQRVTLLRRAGTHQRDMHGNVDPGQLRTRICAAQLRERHAHIGRTSTTSGTKCLSRFWMPCCRVAVEDGQPAQEPFMLR